MVKFACEIFVDEFLPGIRAMLAEELTGKHGLTQREAALRLGLTQSAVSQYKRALRGAGTRALNRDETVVAGIKKLAHEIANGTCAPQKLPEKFCQLCELSKNRKLLDTPTCLREEK
jgi:predicted transcriptional regulator